MPDIRFYDASPINPNRSPTPFDGHLIAKRFFPPNAPPDTCCCEFIALQPGINDLWCVVGPYAVNNVPELRARWNLMPESHPLWRLRVFTLLCNIRPPTLSPGLVDTGDLLNLLEIPRIPGDP